MFVRVLLVGLALAAPAFGEILSGAARVVDGDTLRLAGERVRLIGIDAPEMRQRCRLNGKDWKCGVAARDALVAFIGASTVRCEPNGRDRYRRVLAVCFVGGVDMARWMVRRGLALAYRRYSMKYVPAEDEARRARRGLWAGEFESPWVWRAMRRR